MPERRYARVERVNRAVQEVLADELELLGDEELHLVTVTGVRTDRDLRHALVWFSALSAGEPDLVADRLAAHRPRLQAAIAGQLRLRRTPELTFRADPAIATGTRVEEILKGLHDSGLESGPGIKDGADE
ncbi:MAG: 30S ribosome-binding factor RbfA [Acidimicrobiales bacterium]